MTTIKTKLANLDGYIQDNGSNIEVFNTYVRAQRNKLNARGEQTTDLLVHLFKGYRAVSDRNFVSYIERK